MNTVVEKLLSRASAWMDLEPVIALFVGAAFVALLVAVIGRRREPAATAGATPREPWRRGLAVLGRVAGGLALVGLLVLAAAVLRNYLTGTRDHFRNTHGRVSDANYSAVQTIWGPETAQRELTIEFGYDEEVTERIESEDPTKPVLLKKKIEHRTVPGNPFVSARHEVTLRQNPRRKGSAVYPGYESDCRFTYHLKYPGERPVRAVLRFPLPSSSGIYNDLAVKLNHLSALDQVDIDDSVLVLALDIKKGWEADYEVAFKSRGMAQWYFQVQEPRVIRDFTLLLHLPDLAQAHLNHPEGCMTPTAVTPTADGKGSDLTYRLGQAVSSKGMGIALTKPEQPGQSTNAVLAETDKGWWLLFAVLLLGGSLGDGRQHPLRMVLLTLLVSAAAALGYGFLGDLDDTPLQFWGTLLVVLVPCFGALGWLLWRSLPGGAGRLLALSPLLLGVAYPCLAGLDPTRQTLYLNGCAFLLLGAVAWLVTRPGVAFAARSG